MKISDAGAMMITKCGSVKIAAWQLVCQSHNTIFGIQIYFTSTSLASYEFKPKKV
jgi:hypothetical protein